MRKLFVFGLFLTFVFNYTPAHSSANFSIKIAYKARESSVEQTYSLRCKPSSGSIKFPKLKCNRLLQVNNPFAPTSNDQICSQIFGGPGMARIYGTWEGKKVDTIFTKSNGCEIERWNKIRFLFPRI